MMRFNCQSLLLTAIMLTVLGCADQNVNQPVKPGVKPPAPEKPVAGLTGMTAETKDVATQKKVLDQAVDQQLAALRKQFDGIRDRIARNAAKNPELAELKKAVDEAEATHQKGMAEDAEVVAARKAYDQAKAAHAKASAELKEAKAVKGTATTQIDPHTLPEYAARNKAKAAMDKLAKTDPGYDAASKAYEEAIKAYEAKRLALTEPAKAAEAARKAYDLASKTIPEYKVMLDAEKAYRAVEKERRATFRKASDDARKAFETKVDELAEADPEVKKIEERLRALKALLKDAAGRIQTLPKS